jgi:hypothetical protein
MQHAHYAHPEHSSLEQRTESLIGNYWRVRIATMLDRLEREARRMFHLERELSEFAAEYYAAVGEVTERLTEVEQRIHGESPPEVASMVAPLPDIQASMDASLARRSELKIRYRQLAKEIHPDRAMVTQSTGTNANHMHTLNAAYQQGDLAAMLKLEAEMLLSSTLDEALSNTPAIEHALRELERAANTYADGYRAMLNSPLNELMLRAMSARLAGWDWMQAVVKKVERAIEEKERAMIEANIAAITEWREQVSAA